MYTLLFFSCSRYKRYVIAPILSLPISIWKKAYIVLHRFLGKYCQNHNYHVSAINTSIVFLGRGECLTCRSLLLLSSSLIIAKYVNVLLALLSYIFKCQVKVTRICKYGMLINPQALIGSRICLSCIHSGSQRTEASTSEEYRGQSVGALC